MDITTTNNLILAGILLISIAFVWLLLRVYHAGYENCLKDTRNHSDNLIGEAEQKTRMLEYKLAALKPSPGDTVHVQDYTVHPPSVRLGTCLIYDENTNHVTFLCHGDVFPLTGKYQDGILVMLDYCQEC